MIQVRPGELPGMLIIEPRVFQDERGFFKETYHRDRYAEAGLDAPFVQDNLSRSAKGTLRGMHFQIKNAQGKLVQVLRGEIFDVAVDLRSSSPSFGKWSAIVLSESNHCQLYVPPEFAHGFYVLSDTADVFYKTTDVYSPEHERTLAWDDPQVGIAWPLEGEPVLSEKDRRGTPLGEIECYP